MKFSPGQKFVLVQCCDIDCTSSLDSNLDAEAVTFSVACKSSHCNTFKVL